MKPTVKIAFFFASFYMAFKIILFTQDLQHDENWRVMLIFGNMLFILLAVFFALRHQQKVDKGKETIFLHDFKLVLQSGVVYAVILGVFTFTYYKFIDPGYMEHLVELRMEGSEEFNLEAMGPEYPQGFTKEEIIQKELEASQMLYNPFGISALTTLGLLLMAIFYTFFLVILQRKVLSRLR